MGYRDCLSITKMCLGLLSIPYLAFTFTIGPYIPHYSCKYELITQLSLMVKWLGFFIEWQRVTSNSYPTLFSHGPVLTLPSCCRECMGGGGGGSFSYGKENTHCTQNMYTCIYMSLIANLCMYPHVEGQLYPPRYIHCTVHAGIHLEQ